MYNVRAILDDSLKGTAEGGGFAVDVVEVHLV